MEFTVTVVNPQGDSSAFEYTLPSPLEFSDDDEWYVGVTDFVHNNIYGSEKSLTKDLITLPERPESHTSPLTLNEFAVLILQTAYNPLLYEVDYAENVISRSKNIVELINKNYKKESTTKNVIKVQPFAVLKSDELPAFNIIPKPKLYNFTVNKPRTLLDIFYSLLGQTLKHMLEMKNLSNEAIQTHLSNFLRYIVGGFRKERESFLTKFYNKLQNTLIVVKTDFVSPSICGNQYDQILFTTSNRYDFNDKLKSVNALANYVKVQKKFINKMKFRFCGIDDSPILFKNNVYNYMCIKLHFINKKIQK